MLQDRKRALKRRFSRRKTGFLFFRHSAPFLKLTSPQASLPAASAVPQRRRGRLPGGASRLVGSPVARHTCRAPQGSLARVATRARSRAATRASSAATRALSAPSPGGEAPPKLAPGEPTATGPLFPITDIEEEGKASGKISHIFLRSFFENGLTPRSTAEIYALAIPSASASSCWVKPSFRLTSESERFSLIMKDFPCLRERRFCATFCLVVRRTMFTF